MPDALLLRHGDDVPLRVEELECDLRPLYPTTRLMLVGVDNH
jgi:hypothetical protein